MSQQVILHYVEEVEEVEDVGAGKVVISDGLLRRKYKAICGDAKGLTNEYMSNDILDCLS